MSENYYVNVNLHKNIEQIHFSGPKIRNNIQRGNRNQMRNTGNPRTGAQGYHQQSQNQSISPRVSMPKPNTRKEPYSQGSHTNGQLQTTNHWQYQQNSQQSSLHPSGCSIQHNPHPSFASQPKSSSPVLPNTTFQPMNHGSMFQNRHHSNTPAASSTFSNQQKREILEAIINNFFVHLKFNAFFQLWFVK